MYFLLNSSAFHLLSVFSSLKYSTDVSPAFAPPGCKGVRGTGRNSYSVTTRDAPICKFQMTFIKTFTDTTIALLCFHIILVSHIMEKNYLPKKVKSNLAIS